MAARDRAMHAEHGDRGAVSKGRIAGHNLSKAEADWACEGLVRILIELRNYRLDDLARG